MNKNKIGTSGLLGQALAGPVLGNRGSVGMKKQNSEKTKLNERNINKN